MPGTLHQRCFSPSAAARLTRGCKPRVLSPGKADITSMHWHFHRRKLRLLGTAKNPIRLL
eukprot:5469482-Pyramimonas_sp.AAC.1